MGAKQLEHFVPQHGVAGAGAIDVRGLLGRGKIEHGIEHGVDAPEVFSGECAHATPDDLMVGMSWTDPYPKEGAARPTRQRGGSKLAPGWKGCNEGRAVDAPSEVRPALSPTRR